MDASNYLNFIVRNIHTTIVATVDDEGLPVTAAIDMMDFDESGLYFLTAKGKGFYDRLKKRGVLALTGIKGNDTMSRVAVSIKGKAEEIGSDVLPRLLEKNPYMYDIYPTEESRKALTVFRIFEGSGEWFDLSRKPIERVSFSFGGKTAEPERYYITDACIGCETCGAFCPQNCIDFSNVPAVIKQEHCLHCGNCMQNCPVGAVERR
ncbi:MAG: 4Fe-4S binding protein [Clostridia bacterium]|nr:4Fe-4S binding protein [Clostridia bacterium]